MRVFDQIGKFIRDTFISKTTLDEDIRTELKKINIRHLQAANVMTTLMAVCYLLSDFFFKSPWNPQQLRVFRIADILFLALAVVCFAVVFLYRQKRLSVNFVHFFRLGYLMLIFGWAAVISCFEATTYQNIYTYLIAAFLGSFVFYHRLAELLAILLPVQIFFGFSFSIFPVNTPLSDQFVFISWVSIFAVLLISRIPYSARLKSLISEHSMMNAIREKDTANKSLNDFLRNISHELRTPLTGILGFSEAIIHSSEKNDMIRYAGLIEGEGEKLLTLINRLLDISKIDAGKLEIQNELFSIHKSIERFINSYGERAKLKGLDFICNVDKDIPEYLSGDEDRTIQVLTNLMGNAIKFTREGSIVFSVDVVKRVYDKIILQFKLTDTGIGIDREKQASIFDPFSQEDVSTSREFGGTGLGTTISKKLVELMKGEIDFVSEKGKGSTFRFTIPFTVPRHNKMVPDDGVCSKKLDLTGKRILLVEDYKINQQVAMLHLAKLGCEVTLAENGRECLDILDKAGFDLILLDSQMPVMDGMETVQEIRKSEKLKHYKVIGITANAFESDRKKLLEAGMDDIILKPFRKDEICKKLAAVFRD